MPSDSTSSSSQHDRLNRSMVKPRSGLAATLPWLMVSSTIIVLVATLVISPCRARELTGDSMPQQSLQYTSAACPPSVCPPGLLKDCAQVLTGVDSLADCRGLLNCTASRYQNWHVHCNADILGHDLGTPPGHSGAVENIRECADSCASLDECQAFTFRYGHVNQPGWFNCWLKAVGSLHDDMQHTGKRDDCCIETVTVQRPVVQEPSMSAAYSSLPLTLSTTCHVTRDMHTCGSVGTDAEHCQRFGSSGHVIIMFLGVFGSIIAATASTFGLASRLRNLPQLSDNPVWPISVARAYYNLARKHDDQNVGFFLLCDDCNTDNHEYACEIQRQWDNKGHNFLVPPHEVPEFFCVREATSIDPMHSKPPSSSDTVRVAMCDVHCAMRPMRGVAWMNIIWAVANLFVSSFLLLLDQNAGCIWLVTGAITNFLVLVHIGVVIWLVNTTVPDILDSSLRRMSVCNLRDWGHVIMVHSNAFPHPSDQNHTNPDLGPGASTWWLRPICTQQYILRRGHCPKGLEDGAQSDLWQCHLAVEAAVARVRESREALLCSMGFSALAVLLLTTGNMFPLDPHGIVSSLNALAITFTLAALTRSVDAAYRAVLAQHSNKVAACSMNKVNFPWESDSFTDWMEKSWCGRWRNAKTFLWDLKEENETQAAAESSFHQHKTRSMVYVAGKDLWPRVPGSRVQRILISGVREHDD